MGRDVLRSVLVDAPVRVADVGGWTDTWFAARGAVCPLGVGPGITVAADLMAGAVPDRPVRIVAVDLDEDYPVGPCPDRGWDQPLPGRHPLLEHAIASMCAGRDLPGPVRVRVHAAVPPGASLGTSASVVVALLAAMDALLERPVRDETEPADIELTDDQRRDLAVLAHRVETVRAGRESGVQDQWAAAFGGSQLVEITDYPHARHRRIPLSEAVVDRLGGTLVTVGVGRHDSSAVHREVIAAITTPGAAGATRREVLSELTGLAHEAADALDDGDADRWARILTRCTDAQARLHPDLIGPAHRAVIEHARRNGAIGWKVNGAGGSGGSVTVVFPTPDPAAGFAAHIVGVEPSWSVFDLAPAPGVRVRRRV